jgi:N-acetylmuramoyl-L-alanine amidase
LSAFAASGSTSFFYGSFRSCQSDYLPPFSLFSPAESICISVIVVGLAQIEGTTMEQFVFALAIVVCVFLGLRILALRQLKAVPRLAYPTPPVTDYPSPNFNDRTVAQPSMIVLHYTAMDTTKDALARLSDPKSEVSSHYLVGEDGTIYRLVAEDKRAWHAGVSFWQGGTDINSLSIGIEIANQGDRPYTNAQKNAVRWLCRWILDRYEIKPQCVVGHSDVAPGRKQDPGWFFDWKQLAQDGVGFWADPTSEDYATSANWGETELRSALNQYGYSPTADFKSVIDAFQRHFQQEVANDPSKDSVPDKETAARLAALVRTSSTSAKPPSSV